MRTRTATSGAAATILRRAEGRTPAAVRLIFAGQCISLGRDEGIIQFARPDDRLVALTVGGRRGARVKEFVCRTTLRQLAAGARKAGARGDRASSGSLSR